MDEKASARIVGNSGVYLAGQLFSRAFDVVTILILARYLGVRDFGKFSFAFSYVGLFSVFIDWGVYFILIRETSRPGSRGPALLGSGIALKFALSSLAIVITGASVFLLPYSKEIRILVAIVSFNLLVSFRLPSFRDIFEVPLIARLKMRFSAAASVLNRILTFIAITTVILLKGPLWVLALVYTWISLPALLLIASWAMREIRPVFGNATRNWAYLLKEGFPLGLSGIFYILVSQFDIFLLSQTWSVQEIGLYNAARRLTEPLELIPSAISFSLLPMMSQLSYENISERTKLYAKSLLFVLLGAPLLIAILVLGSRPLVHLLFGGNFASAEPSLIILSFYLPFIFAFQMTSNVFIATNRQKTALYIWLPAFLLNVGLNSVLVPRFSFVGASWSRLITGVFVTVLGWIFVSKFVGRVPFVPMIKIAGLAVPLILALKFYVPLGPVASIGVFLLLYGGGIFALKILSPEDKDFLKKFLRPKRIRLKSA